MMQLWGLGTAVPAHAMKQQDAALASALVSGYSEEETGRLQKLYRITGIDRRYSVLFQSGNGGSVDQRQDFFHYSTGKEDQGPPLSARMERYEAEAPKLAVQAAEKALEEADVEGARVTHVVTVSCSGFNAPGIDVQLIKQLGLQPTVQRTHVGFMGCHAAVNGLRVARSFVGSDPAAVVLVVAVELCTLHYNYQWDAERNIANALFADGAAAAVCGASKHHDDTWTARATGSCLIPDSEDAMSWRIRDHGFVMTLSSEVPRLIQAHLRPWLEVWLKEQGLRVEDIQSWAVHPGGPSILRAAGQALGLQRDQMAESWQILREFGNMSSPTLLFILSELRNKQAQRPCVLLGFGPGLVAEALLLE